MVGRWKGSSCSLATACAVKDASDVTGVGRFDAGNKELVRTEAGRDSVGTRIGGMVDGWREG